MTALRCLIDSMIFDEVAREPELTAMVDRLTRARRLELLAATASIAQVAATPDPERRRRLQRVRVLVVAPADDDRTLRPVIARLRDHVGVDPDDALIAAAAAAQDVPLVTEDRALRLAVAGELAHLPVWSWMADLRPRILALAAAAGGS